jgi:hypothetical protein
MAAMLAQEFTLEVDSFNGRSVTVWRKAMAEEIQSMMDKNVFVLIKRQMVPKNKKILHILDVSV